MNYRCALEIAREGELEITVPNLENGRTGPPKAIPKVSPKDVLDSFDKLLYTYKSLLAKGEEEAVTIYDIPEEQAEAPKGKKVHLLQVKIKYSLSQSTTALAFRRQSPFVGLFDKGAKSAEKAKAICSYSTSFSPSFYNPDGVRCWLPCLDSLDQRYLFDISLSVAKNHPVCCSGRRLAVSRRGKSKRFQHRFFTPTRLPACQLGWFIGKVESYKMSLYKAKGKIWVATGLADYLSSAEHADHPEPAPAPAEQEPVADSAGQVDGGTALTKRKRDDDHPMISMARRLYAEKVHHSFLGMDMALRLLHKFTGHKYDYDAFAFIFIHDLGVDFMTFDGFALVDAKFLHSAGQVYLESAAHHILLRAYLTAWLTSTVPIASYEDEYILKGAVGYLLHFYMDEVYGEDEGQYFYQKHLDAVLAFEKQSRAVALQGFYPERYDIFTVFGGEYMSAKALVVFHLLEQMLGGRDPMRLVLKHIIKSSATATIALDAIQAMGMSATSSPFLSTPNQSPMGLGASPPYSQGCSPETMESSSPLGTGHTPYGSTYGYQSPYPYMHAGHTSPAAAYYGQRGGLTYGEASPQYGYMSPMGRPSLTRQSSATAAAVWSWEKDLQHAGDYLSTETFLILLHHACENASQEIDDASLLQLIGGSSSALFLRVHLAVSERVENKPRTITISTDQIGHRHGKLGKAHCSRGELPVLMVEDRDDNVSEPSVLYSDHLETHKQHAYSRPGRRGGKRRKLRDVSQLTEQQLAEMAFLEREKENHKSALQLARDLEYPVKYILVDSACKHLVEIQNTSSDSLLVEQLHASFESHPVVDKHRLLYAVQALRSISRAYTAHIHAAIPQAHTAGTFPTAPAGAAAEKSARVQLKACSDVILGVTTEGMQQHSVFVRAEAAFALANWQNENAPFSISEDYDSSLGWPGMEMLLDCLLELFVDTQKQVPLVVDCHNDGSVYLRNSLLLALSTIKSQQGYSPLEVIEIIVLFAEHLDAADDDAGADGAGSEEVDHSHDQAILLLCLSRLRYPPIDVSPSAVASQSVYKVMSIALHYIEDAMTAARSIARIDHLTADANMLPSLPDQGLAVAAAITILSEIDIQAIQDFTSARGNGGSKLRHLDEEAAPTAHGILSHFRYQDYFLRPGMELKCVIEDQHSKKKLKDEFIFFLCSPQIRLAAFEAFVRISFTLHHAKLERLDVAAKAGGGTGAKSIQGIDKCWFIAAAVEALQQLLEHDASVHVKQQAAHIFFDTLLERPARVVMANISHGHVWGCMGWADLQAFTVPHRAKAKGDDSVNSIKQFVSCRKSREAMVRTGGKSMKIALDFLLKAITRTGACNQVQRSAFPFVVISQFFRPFVLCFCKHGSIPSSAACPRCSGWTGSLQQALLRSARTSCWKGWIQIDSTSSTPPKPTMTSSKA